MRVTQTIPIGRIDYDKLPRSSKVLKLVLWMLAGNLCAPVKVERKGDRFLLKDGRHRLKAHMLLGESNIRAIFAVPEEPYPYKPLATKESK